MAVGDIKNGSEKEEITPTSAPVSTPSSSPPAIEHTVKNSPTISEKMRAPAPPKTAVPPPPPPEIDTDKIQSEGFENSQNEQVPMGDKTLPRRKKEKSSKIDIENQEIINKDKSCTGSTSKTEEAPAKTSTMTSQRGRKSKSGSYDFVALGSTSKVATLKRVPDLVTELGLTRIDNKPEVSATMTSQKSSRGRQRDEAGGSLSESEPVLLKEHRKLPDGDDVITMRPISVTTSVNSLQASPLLTQAQKQRMLSSAGKRKPGSRADRIRKIIPEQASLFNEKVKPELNRILNERNNSVRPGGYIK